MTTEGRENESAEAAESDAVGARLSAVLPGRVRRRTGAGIFQKEEQEMEENENNVLRLFWVKGVKCSDLLEEMSAKELRKLLGAATSLRQSIYIRLAKLEREAAEANAVSAAKRCYEEKFKCARAALESMSTEELNAFREMAQSLSEVALHLLSARTMEKDKANGQS